MGLAQIAGMAVLPRGVAGRRPGCADGCGFIAHLGADGAGRVRRTGRSSARRDLARGAAVGAGDRGLLRRRAGRVAGVAVGDGATGSRAWPSGARLARRRGRGRRGGACGSRFEPWAIVAARGDGRLHVTFIDVGQGDAAFVRFPRGATMLVDAGGSSSTVLRHRRPRRRAGAARRRRPPRSTRSCITHGDADHAGGAVVDAAGAAAVRCVGGRAGAASAASPAAARGRRRRRRPLDERPAATTRC